VGGNAVGFASAAKDIVLVVTPEPTSVADASGMLRVLCSRCAVRRVKVLTNMVDHAAQGEHVFRDFSALTARFSDVGLEHLGSIPRDPAVCRAVMRGQPVVLAYPESPAALALTRVAAKLLDDEDRDERQGALRLFWRRLLLVEGNR
jgi:flagellar biosynthesis protein FlhG